MFFFIILVYFLFSFHLAVFYGFSAASEPVGDSYYSNGCEISEQALIEISETVFLCELRLEPQYLEGDEQLDLPSFSFS